MASKAGNGFETMAERRGFAGMHENVQSFFLSRAGERSKSCVVIYTY